MPTAWHVPSVGAAVIQFPRNPPGLTARVTDREWNRIAQRYGDLKGSTLQSVLDKLQRGEVTEWSDLVEFALRTDADLTAEYSSRVNRVVQADWIVAPSERGDQRVAKLAAEFADDMINRVDNWDHALKNFMHALAPGFSANEMEWDRSHKDRLYYVRNIHYRHGNRFRYGKQWDLRLYDRGNRPGKDHYGEVLRPDLWIVHTHQEQAGYPNTGGVMHACMWPWLFKRWVEKQNISFVEKYGHPYVYVNVDPDTPDAVRDQIFEDLQNLSYDHVAVAEGHTINMEFPKGAPARDVHGDYIDRQKDAIAKAWHGVTDANGPGENGARAAVEARLGFAADPRMVSDGVNLGNTLRKSYFKQLFQQNNCLRLFGVPADEVPLPEFRFKTADDEARVDQGDKAEEIREEQGIEVRGEPQQPAPEQPQAQPAQPGAPQPATEDVQKEALNGAQIDNLKGIVKDVAIGEIPRSSGIELLITSFPSISREQAEAIIGEAGQGFRPASQEDKPAPVEAPPPPPPEMRMSVDTSGFEAAIRNGVDRVVDVVGSRSSPQPPIIFNEATPPPSTPQRVELGGLGDAASKIARALERVADRPSPPIQLSIDYPKAQAGSSSPATRTSQTTAASRSPLALALRGELDALGSSSSKARSKRRKHSSP